MSRKGRLVVGLAAGLLALPNQALSYLLPAEAILSSMGSRREAIGFDTLVAEGTIQRGTEAPVTLWEGIKAGKAHRVEKKRDGATEVTLSIGAKRWRFPLGQKAAAPTKVEGDLVMTFLAQASKDPGGARGVQLCTFYGIDLSVVSLGRLEKRPAFIIGAKPWESTKPQLWVDTQYRVPVRLIAVDKTSGELTDTRLFGYGSPATSEWYPNRVEIWQGGKLVETTIYQSAALNVAIDDKLLAPPS